VLAFALHLSRIARHGLGFILHIYHRPFWLLAPILLAICFERRRNPKTGAIRGVLVFGAILALMGLSVLSPHRSRPIFGVGIVASVCLLYRYFRRGFLTMASFSAVALLFLVLVTPDRLPNTIRRSLSTVIPVDADAFRSIAHEEGISYEYGWQSNFRATMNRVGFMKIRSSPLVGTGFRFQVEDLLVELVPAGGQLNPAVMAKATSGGYHNSVLTLAVFCGIPCALLFVVGLLVLPLRFIRVMRNHPDREFRIWSAGLLGFMVASSGQMLINGHAFDMFTVNVLLGTMNGIMIRLRRQEQEARLPAPAPEALAVPRRTLLPALDGA
jgi:hypothetical protein